MITNLKTELHIPGYQFCGPGTKLRERLVRGDKGVDAACREHDIAYSKYKDIPTRHIADKILEGKAWQRVKSKDASFGEKTSAWFVTNTMKAKRKLGMGCIPFKGGVVKKVRNSIRGMKTKNIKQIAKIALGAARHAVKGVGGKRKIRTPRIIPIPKTGGILPFLIPLFAGLSAVGGLAGGAAGITRAVNAAKDARKRLEESERHNKTMEAIALGKKGQGLFLAPYRKGMGLYLKPPAKNFL